MPSDLLQHAHDRAVEAFHDGGGKPHAAADAAVRTVLEELRFEYPVRCGIINRITGLLAELDGRQQ